MASVSSACSNLHNMPRVSLTAPLEYTALVWAFLLGFIVWGDAPRPGVFLGATLILVAGLLLITHRNAYKRPC